MIGLKIVSATFAFSHSSNFSVSHPVSQTSVRRRSIWRAPRFGVGEHHVVKCRFLGKHQTLLAVDHARVLRAMRAEAAAPVPVVETTVEERNLSDYDRITEVAS